MRVIDPGHVYDLTWLDADEKEKRGIKIDGLPIDALTKEFGSAVVLGGHQPDVAPTGSVRLCPDRLIFVKREGDKYPGNVGHHPGTTMQEVLRVLIDRLKYVNQQIPDKNNAQALGHMRDALYYLERRAAIRHGLPVFFWLTDPPKQIEEVEPCPHCGHIFEHDWPECGEKHKRESA